MSAVATDVLAGLAPVALDELVDRAALLTRVDRKYLVPGDAAIEALDALDPRTRVLEIDGRRSFGYDSVYFDTPDHLSYRLTAQRRRRRFKLRTRSYLDTGSTYLEVKTRGSRGTTVKERIDHDPGCRERLTPRAREFVEGILREQGHEPGLVASLRSSLAVSYRRTTLLMIDGTRATFDSRLRWADEDRRLALPGFVIVETKTHGRPGELDRALWSRGHRPTVISKFGTGTAALHPELPHNKWARLLRGPFA